MCGIFTAIYKNKDNLNLSFCKNSLDKLKKRGPDWSFQKLIDKNFFGQTVLSMSGKKLKNTSNHISRSKRYLLLLNGEIYNYHDLNNKYSLNLGKDFSDTKVLVNLFDRLNIKQIIKELDGMYAFVLFDNYLKKIYFSRDLQGEKSLYFYEDEEKFLISSENSTFLNKLCKTEINKDSIQTYFNSRHYLQLRETAYKNIKNILPGETIEFDLKTFKKKTILKQTINDWVNERIYKDNKNRTLEDLTEELEGLLINNLRRMSPEKRKFCSILSGGVDSTLVSKLIEENLNPSFLLTVNHIGKDRISNQIDKFKKYFKSKIKIINLDLKNYYNKLKISTKICSSPIGSHDFPGKLFMAEVAKKEGCKAIFGGDGADEIFGGYSTYSQIIKNFKVNNSEYSKFKNSIFNFKGVNKSKFRFDLERNWKKCFKTYEFLKKDERNRQAMMLMDTSLQLSSVGLRGNDLMFMSHSVEPRSIFLRKEIITFGLNLPLKYKINLSKNENLSSKIILKRIFLKYFPKTLLFKKQGFSGFPNETITFLNKPINFEIKKFITPNNVFKKFNSLNSANKWKLINFEHFYKNQELKN